MDDEWHRITDKEPSRPSKNYLFYYEDEDKMWVTNWEDERYNIKSYDDKPIVWWRELPAGPKRERS